MTAVQNGDGTWAVSVELDAGDDAAAAQSAADTSSAMTPAELATVLGLSDGSVSSNTGASVEKTGGKALPPGLRQCYLTVKVKDTDYDAADEFVIHTTVDGEAIHGRCSVSDGAELDERNFFQCASSVPMPLSRDGTYHIRTAATPTVDENAFDGSFVYVEYMVDCEGDCRPPSAPPSQPPLPPTCEYSATPAGGGDTDTATSTFTDPHAPMAALPPPLAAAAAISAAAAAGACAGPDGYFAAGTKSRTAAAGAIAFIPAGLYWLSPRPPPLPPSPWPLHMPPSPASPPPTSARAAVTAAATAAARAAGAASRRRRLQPRPWADGPAAAASGPAVAAVGAAACRSSGSAT